MNYDEYVDSKRITVPPSGFEPGELNPLMFDYQRDITRWSIRRGKAALFQDCGLGKSFEEWEFAHQVTNHTDQPVLLVAPLSVGEQMAVEAPRFGYGVNLCRNKNGVRAGINITNYEMIHRFDPDVFAGIILDECFSAGTMIDVVCDGRITTTAIEEIREGDSILNASGVDTVSDIHRRKIDYAIKVFVNGQSIICSPNHPWFTCKGWKAAQDLEPGDQIVATNEAMRMVRQGLYAETLGRSEGQAVLQSILLSEMANEPTGAFGQSSYTRNRSEARAKETRMVAIWESESASRDRASAGFESNEESRNKKKGVIHIEGHESRTFRAWGERAWFDASPADFTGCARRELDGGICFIVGETNTGLSNMLQARLGESRAKSCYRSGWAFTSQQKSARHQKGCKTRFYGVEGIEILEPGNPELERFRDQDGNIYFYDLGGTRHPSFSVGGCLVHNSSILKGGSLGKMSNDLVDFAKNIPYRLCATATPSPNDIIELTFHAEFLGIMKESEVKALFFTQDGNSSNKFRLKRNAVEKFYQWLASWAVAMRKPSDLGYSDKGFELPELIIEQIVVDSADQFANGTLFQMEAHGIDEQRRALRNSIAERVKITADMVNGSNDQWLVWCQLNPESEAIAKAIPTAVEVAGSHSPEHKIDAMLGFLNGRYTNVISKPSIFGFGMNFQHSNHAVFCGLGNSFERYYQAIKRQHRFGQKADKVYVYVVTTPADGAVVENIKRKWQQNDSMFDNLVKHMAIHIDFGAQTRHEMEYEPKQVVTVPAWLQHPVVTPTEPGMRWIDLDAIPFQIDGSIQDFWDDAHSVESAESVDVPSWVVTISHNPESPLTY